MYDIIGDIHGYSKHLTRLLEKLGYSVDDGVYRHPDRIAVFLGDFIDRGPGQEQVLNIVMPMVCNGNALSVMGNHEYNSLAYHTVHPEKQGEFLRPHTQKNNHQHSAFLREFDLPDREQTLNEVLDFFKSLPLWLDLGGIRVVHACWHPSYMELLSAHLGPNNRITEDLLVSSSDPQSIHYTAT